MSEREIREILQSVCTRLDEGVRQGARKVVLPAMLGVGLAAIPRCAYGAPDDYDADAVMDAAETDGSQTDEGIQPLYMAPDSIETDGGLDQGPNPAYMAPDN